jgi:hypothetical protein
MYFGYLLKYEIDWNKAAILIDESSIDKIPGIVDNF